jgi:hypothetical protein
MSAGPTADGNFQPPQVQVQIIMHRHNLLGRHLKIGALSDGGLPASVHIGLRQGQYGFSPSQSSLRPKAGSSGPAEGQPLSGGEFANNHRANVVARPGVLGPGIA